MPPSSRFTSIKFGTGEAARSTSTRGDSSSGPSLRRTLAKLRVRSYAASREQTTATSAVFNMATQFGGGKTHALTLLYHLATHGPDAKKWIGVDQILENAQVAEVPKAATAVVRRNGV